MRIIDHLKLYASLKKVSASNSWIKYDFYLSAAKTNPENLWVLNVTSLFVAVSAFYSY